MKVVLLCGGLGTRLREYTDSRPKPMVEIGGQPILWHIMRTYAHYGFNDFILCLGYKGDVIRDYFQHFAARRSDCTIEIGPNGQQHTTWHDPHAASLDFRVTLAETGAESMTGGRLKAVERYIESDTFLLSYGDGLSDVPIDALVRFHRSHGGKATVTAVQPESRYGVLRINDANHTVTGFEEKPKSRDWINAGFFVFHRDIFKLLDGPKCILERAPLETLAKQGHLHAYRHDGFFQAMDTSPEHQYLNQLWTSGNAPWKVWDKPLAATPDLLHLAMQLTDDRHSKIKELTPA